MATEKYIEAVGRRKTATARVRLAPAKSQTIMVNDKPLADYFFAPTLQKNILQVFNTDDITAGTYVITIKVEGSGLSAQSDAIKLGIARALVKENPSRRIPLKKAGYLKRDPRSVERKKFGLLKARKRPQWAKR